MIGMTSLERVYCVVLRLGVDKGLILRSGMLETPFNTLRTTLRKGGRRQELKIVFQFYL